MNEYTVTIELDGVRRDIVVLAASAAAARAQAEETADVVAVRFLRAVGFSCRVRDGGRT